jgi:2-keto-4-pentenoate hydratase/2-oxohepta-3-ene-1,7-dioic acid hydratase in catechol pathway
MPRPTGTIMCIGKNYADHIKEVDTWKSAPGISTPEAPEDMIIFTKAPQSVIGPGAAINYPHGWSELVDYEAELAVIIRTDMEFRRKMPWTTFSVVLGQKL